MKTIIDMPEDVYEEIKSGDWDNLALEGFCEAVRKGTPLPKGHGKIIDVSQLLTVTEYREDGAEYCYVPYTHIEDALAIVEADKAEGDDKE